MDVHPSGHDGEMRRSRALSRDDTPLEIRVLAAATGICYPIKVHPHDLTVSNLRRHLAGAVPYQDQILLLGPPYKVPKDSTLRSHEVLSSLRLGDEEDNPLSSGKEGTLESLRKGCALSTTECSGACRLFLFSKQALSESAPDPLPCVLQPTILKVPTEPDASPVIFPHSATSQSSPLHQALEVYERRFMLHLCRGKALADGADMRLTACATCVAEQSVMARALRAAVSNLSDHRNGAARTRAEFTSEFQAKTASHSTLLDRFQHIMLSLEEEPLHPEIVCIAKSSGRIMETLLDTVPVEREKAWANQCRTAHERVMSLFEEIDSAFSQLCSISAKEDEVRQDQEAEEEVKRLFAEVENDAMHIRDRQAKRLDRLTRDHGEVVRVVMDAISEKIQYAQAAFTTLEELSKSSEDILPAMESDDVLLKDLMKRVGDAKTRAMRRMRQRLRQVSTAQSSIQRVLSSLAVLREALAHQCENMVHLEHVAELKSSYREFISEIRRRRAYGKAVTSISAAMMERLALMRADEVKIRERFLRGSGRHLMPPFYEIFAPTLATPPPLFTPQLPAMIEMDSLPNLGLADISQLTPSSNTSSEGTTSILMEAQQPVKEEFNANRGRGLSIDSAGAAEEYSNANKDGRARADTAEVMHQEESLIVSADNTTDMMETCQEDRIEAEAEAKTLAYENAILRQALERLGGKAPRSYVQAAREKDTKERNKVCFDVDRQNELEESKAAKNEVSSMKSQIVELEKQLQAAKTEGDLLKRKTAKVKIEKIRKGDKKCDKISHSSFKVGDVGLFMPTGRARSGKRTYLAFHTNCPHRYLSSDSIDGTPDYVLGRIIYQEENQAGALGSESNPFSLHVGTKFWVLTVEVLKMP